MSTHLELGRIALVAGLLAMSLAPVSAADRAATLTVIHDQVCQMMGRSFPTIAADTVPLNLPEISGPFVGNGKVVLSDFINPPVSGTSHYEGEVQDDGRELILIVGRWAFPLSPSNKHGPIIGSKPPVTIYLDPVTETVEKYTDTSTPGAVCTGSLTYRIDFVP